MVQIDSTTPENVHQISVFSAAQDGQLFTLFKLLEELISQQDRNKAINTVRENTKA